MLLKTFSGDVGKTAVKKVLKNYQKNVFSSALFKKFELSNPPTYSYAKTDSGANISFVGFENFKIGWRKSAVKSYLSKVAKIFGFCREILLKHSMFRKVALLEILRSPLLTESTDLQYRVYTLLKTNASLAFFKVL